MQKVRTHPIEIGFSNNIFNNPRDIVGCIKKISSQFKTIEIELAEEAQEVILESSDEDYHNLTNNLLALKKEQKLTYWVHAAWFGPNTDLLNPNLELRKQSIDLLEKSISFATDLESGIVTFHPGNSNGRSTEELVTLMIQTIQETVTNAANNNVSLCLEIMGAHRPKYAIFYPDDLIKICEQTGMYICLDIPHLASLFPETETLLLAVRKLAPYTKQVHIADTNLPQHRHIPIGYGNVPIKEILLTLEEEGYNNGAIVEEYNKGYTPEQYWDAALAFRKDYIENKVEI